VPAMRTPDVDWVKHSACAPRQGLPDSREERSVSAAARKGARLVDRVPQRLGSRAAGSCGPRPWLRRPPRLHEPRRRRRPRRSRLQCTEQALLNDLYMHKPFQASNCALKQIVTLQVDQHRQHTVHPKARVSSVRSEALTACSACGMLTASACARAQHAAAHCPPCTRCTTTPPERDGCSRWRMSESSWRNVARMAHTCGPTLQVSVLNVRRRRGCSGGGGRLRAQPGRAGPAAVVVPGAPAGAAVRELAGLVGCYELRRGRERTLE
jgi:hypothetical protein